MLHNSSFFQNKDASQGGGVVALKKAFSILQIKLFKKSEIRTEGGVGAEGHLVYSIKDFVKLLVTTIQFNSTIVPQKVKRFLKNLLSTPLPPSPYFKCFKHRCTLFENHGGGSFAIFWGVGMGLGV
jgi:hypothetical protein